VLAIYSYELLPPKKLLIIPSNHIPRYIYADNKSNGEPMVRWFDFNGMGWECDIENDGSPHVCGFNVSLGGGQGTAGIDLSSYKTINIDMDYTGGDQRLRFYLRNYEPGFSNIDDMQTAKFNNVHVPVEYIHDGLVLSLSEFAVAEWWITGHKAPRENSLPNFQHVVAFGIDISYPGTPGHHKFKLKKLEFVGEWVSRDDWYLGIMVFWVSVILIGGAINLAHLRKEIRREHQRLERLANQNSVLAKETDKYKKLSMLDPLTGLLNRQGLAEFIEQYFPQGSQRRVSLIVIDIDHFKKINDTLGHDGGDYVLRQVTDLIKNNTRQTDQVARWGGEEFVMILPDTSAENAYRIAEEMRALIANASFEAYPQLHVTVSLGAGTSNGDIPFEELFRNVDLALYQAKAKGRNCAVVAGPSA
jgi:diguanylate cyclase (GGDEF)-like protein